MDQTKTIKIDQITPHSQNFQLHFQIIQIIIKDSNQILCRIVDQTGIVNARFDKFASKLQKSGVYFMTNLTSNLVNDSLRVQMTPETVITREPDIIGYKDKVNDISKKKFYSILQAQQNKQKKIEQKRIQVVKTQGIITENHKKQQILIPLSKQQAQLQIKLKNQFYKRQKKQKERVIHKQKNHLQQAYKQKNRSNEGVQQRWRDEKEREKQEQKQRQKYRQKHQYKQKQIRSQSNRNNNHHQQKHGSKYEEKEQYRQTKSRSVLYRQKQEKRTHMNQQKQTQKQKNEQQKYQSKERTQNKYEEKKSNDFHYKDKYYPKPQDQKPAQIRKQITSNQEKKIKVNQNGKKVQINSKAAVQNKLKEEDVTLKEEKDELERQNQQKRQLAFSKGECIEIINITTQIGNCVNIKAWITKKQRKNEKTNQKERLIADSTGAVWLRTDKMNLESEQYYQIDNLEVCKEEEKIFLKEYEITQARRLEGTIPYTNREINSRE